MRSVDNIQVSLNSADTKQPAGKVLDTECSMTPALHDSTGRPWTFKSPGKKKAHDVSMRLVNDPRSIQFPVKVGAPW